MPNSLNSLKKIKGYSEFYPEAGGARQYCEKLNKRGLLCKETHDHIIRFTPPLVITKDQIEWALEIISSVLNT